MVDYLSRRLLRLMKEERKRKITLENGLKLVPGLIQVVAQPIKKIRLLIGCIIILCYIVFLMQVVNSIRQYLGSPIKTDVMFVGQTDMTFPSITMCSSETAQLDNLLGKGGSNQLNKIVAILNKDLNLSADEIWRLTATIPNLLAAIIYHNHRAVPELVSVRHELIPIGNCCRIDFTLPPDLSSADDLSIFLQFYYHPGSNFYILGSLQSKDEDARIQGTFVAPAGVHIVTPLLFKEFRFINRQQSPCMTRRDKIACEKACRLKELKRKLNCRFPFIPEDIGNIVCDVANMTTEKAKMAYENNVKALWITSDMKACRCYRSCHHYIYGFGEGVAPPSGSNVSNFYLHTSKDLYTIFQERYKYELISFLSDIGGNMGLFLGLSIPTIAEIVWFASTYQKLYNTFQSRKTDPLYKKIVRIMQQESFVSASNAVNLKLVLCQKWDTKFLVIVCCSILWIILLFIRTSQFSSGQKSFTVDAIADSAVEFPIILICSENIKCESLKRIANKRLNKTSYCDIGFYELLSNNKATDLWTKCSNVNILKSSNLNAMKKDAFGVDPFGPFNIEPYQSIDGPCSRISLGKQEYYGFISMFVAGGKINNKCQENFTQKLYIVPEHRQEAFWDFDWWYPLGKMYSFKIIESKKLHRLSTSQRPCVDAQKSEDCQQNCLKKTLGKKVNCWLPFMPSMPSVPICNTTIEALQAKNIFKKIYLLITEKAGCGCLNSCEEYIRSMYSWYDKSPVSSFFLVTLAMGGSEVEQYVETWDDNATKFLSDIGGTLGIMLGISVILLVNIITNTIFSLT